MDSTANQPLPAYPCSKTPVLESDVAPHLREMFSALVITFRMQQDTIFQAALAFVRKLHDPMG